jgi:hypothetical protein
MPSKIAKGKTVDGLFFFIYLMAAISFLSLSFSRKQTSAAFALASELPTTVPPISSIIVERSLIVIDWMFDDKYTFWPFKRLYVVS